MRNIPWQMQTWKVLVSLNSISNIILKFKLDYLFVSIHYRNQTSSNFLSNTIV